MSESRVRENRTHGSTRRREATPDQSASPRGPRKPPADPTKEPVTAGRVPTQVNTGHGAARRVLPRTYDQVSVRRWRP
jgi:hypothetical protein